MSWLIKIATLHHSLDHFFLFIIYFVVHTLSMGLCHLSYYCCWNRCYSPMYIYNAYICRAKRVTCLQLVQPYLNTPNPFTGLSKTDAPGNLCDEHIIIFHEPPSVNLPAYCCLVSSVLAVHRYILHYYRTKHVRAQPHHWYTCESHRQAQMRHLL